MEKAYLYIQGQTELGQGQTELGTPLTMFTLTCLMYSLVVKTSSKYTTHLGSSWNRLLFGWMCTV